MYTIKLKTQFFKEDGVMVGVAPELNVSSFGENLREARRSLAEAIEGFLETCRDLGTLEEVLEEAGFNTRQDKYIWEPSKIIRQEQLDFKIEPSPAYA
ncbi:MAG: type II toxin-antitoxin system HicB family antitoxin [Patescibacteria group bacterium]